MKSALNYKDSDIIYVFVRVPESSLKFVWKLAFFMCLGYILWADFFKFDNWFALQWFVFQATSSIATEYWIPFICCKENWFVFADWRRKIFFRTSHLPKSAAGKSAADFTLVTTTDSDDHCHRGTIADIKPLHFQNKVLHFWNQRKKPFRKCWKIVDFHCFEVNIKIITIRKGSRHSLSQPNKSNLPFFSQVKVLCEKRHC